MWLCQYGTKQPKFGLLLHCNGRMTRLFQHLGNEDALYPGGEHRPEARERGRLGTPGHTQP